MHAARSPQLPPVRPRGGRALAVLRRFLHVEAVGGVILLVAVLAALAWANSPLRGSYAALWQASIFFQPLHFWINDGLMTAFFLVVGAEIRREMHSGALSSLRQAALPVVAAIGGVIVPALVYLSLNLDAARRPGWAVPTATDIAFAVGVLALLGRRIPDNVRVFLLTLAIVDDIVAVLIIAFFYAGGLDWRGFAIAGLGVLIVLGLQRLRVGRVAAYVIPGAIVWVGLFQAGAHPTLAGVVLGLMTPVLPVCAHEQPPAVRVPQALHPWVAYGILPLFALANAGVAIGGIDWSSGGTPWIAAGIAVALVAGKPLGVMGASWLAVRLGWCALPPDVPWRGVALIGLLAGIGFTMSIFIATLGFADERVLAAAKLGVLAGSAVAATLGLAWGAAYAARTRNFSVPE